MQNTSDFQRQSIYNCYCLLKDMIHIDNIEDEDFFYERISDIEKLRIVMPEALFVKIEGFINNSLLPVMEDPNFWEELHTPEIGSYKDDNCFEIKPDKLACFCARVFEKIHTLNEELDAFAFKELRPFLI